MYTKQILATAAVGLAVFAASITPAQAATHDVYGTPGAQIVGDRLWNTTCSMYSSTVVRCATDIWATQVVYRNGSYQRVTGWTFNNLTYLPSSRAAWKNNNLGHNATWTQNGRQWRTECDTAATGRGACRSYIKGTFIKATKTATGYTYSRTSGWMFNNMVRFAENGVAPVTRIPADVLHQSVIDNGGLGPLELGTQMSDLVKLGYAKSDWRTNGGCFGTSNPATDAVAGRGIEIFSAPDTGVLSAVNIWSAEFKTDKGARVGMKVSDVQKLYGTAFKPTTEGGESWYAKIQEYNTVLLFGLDPESQTVDVISVYINGLEVEC